MSFDVNQKAWEKMIDEDMKWLQDSATPDIMGSLERKHILECLRWLRENKPTPKKKGGANKP